MKANPERLFLFRLARELGMSVSRVLEEIDSRELSEWMAFFWLENEDRERKLKEREKPTPKQLSEKFKAQLGGFKGGRKGR